MPPEVFKRRKEINIDFRHNGFAYNYDGRYIRLSNEKILELDISGINIDRSDLNLVMLCKFCLDSYYQGFEYGKRCKAEEIKNILGLK